MILGSGGPLKAGHLEKPAHTAHLRPLPVTISLRFISFPWPAPAPGKGMRWSVGDTNFRMGFDHQTQGKQARGEGRDECVPFKAAGLTFAPFLGAL